MLLPLRDPLSFHRLWKYVDTDGDCWEWTGGCTSRGYGTFWWGEGAENPSGRVSAHRAVWLVLVGPIPEEKELDHLCYNKTCVNPDHLRAVSHQENVDRRRWYPGFRRLKCRKGLHEFTEANTYWLSNGRRRCRACMKALEATRVY